MQHRAFSEAPCAAAAKTTVRPKKRKGVEGEIKSWFQKASEKERRQLMECLIRGGYVVDDVQSALRYALTVRELELGGRSRGDLGAGAAPETGFA